MVNLSKFPKTDVEMKWMWKLKGIRSEQCRMNAASERMTSGTPPHACISNDQ